MEIQIQKETHITITAVNGTAIIEGQTIAVIGGTVKLVGGKLEVTPDENSLAACYF